MVRSHVILIVVALVLISLIEVNAGRIVRSPQFFQGPGGPPPPRPFGPGAFGPFGSGRFGPGGYSRGRFGLNRPKLPQVSISISKSISIGSGGSAQSSAGSSARGK